MEIVDIGIKREASHSIQSFYVVIRNTSLFLFFFLPRPFYLRIKEILLTIASVRFKGMRSKTGKTSNLIEQITVLSRVRIFVVGR